MCSDQYFKNGVIVLLHGPWSLSVWVADVDLHLNNGPPGFSHGSQIQTHPCTMGPPICWGGHPSGNPSKPHLLISYKITVFSRKPATQCKCSFYNETKGWDECDSERGEQACPGRCTGVLAIADLVLLAKDAVLLAVHKWLS